MRWRIEQRRSKDIERLHSVILEKGFKRIEGSEPQSIESLRDIVVEILEGGFLEDEKDSGHVVWFSVVEIND